MNILIIGGLHGDESLGIDLVKLIKNNPIERVSSIFGNPAAIAVNTRYVDKYLNRVFPGKLDGCIEEVRAKKIVEIAKDFDLIIDFHNTTSDNCNCSFVGNQCQDLLFDVSGFLGLKDVVVADYDCINKFVSSCISIEISYSSQICNANYWYQKIQNLSETLNKNSLPKNTFNKYKIAGNLKQKPDQCLRNFH